MSIAIVTLRDALVEQVHTQVLLLSVKDQHCHIYMQYALVNYKMCIVHSIWPHNQPKTYLSLTNLISKQVTHSSILACHCVLLLIIVHLLEGKSQIRNTHLSSGFLSFCDGKLDFKTSQKKLRIHRPPFSWSDTCISTTKRSAFAPNTPVRNTSSSLVVFAHFQMTDLKIYEDMRRAWHQRKET